MKVVDKVREPRSAAYMHNDLFLPNGLYKKVLVSTKIYLLERQPQEKL
jgi:hypothetical protein